GGRAEIMEQLTPDGSIFHAGTLSGNPLAMAAGISTLKIVRDDVTLYERLEVLARVLVEGFDLLLEKHGVPHCGAYAGSMWGVFFTKGPVTDLDSAKSTDTALYARFFHAMLDRGIYLAPAAFETAFLSTAHTTRDIEATLAAADESLTEILCLPQNP
ncbi:MAG: aminotransferase class III-fold pyridoxal phosphate-dependent enzyme, partial [Vulcanimicrobiaceae bacterium]